MGERWRPIEGFPDYYVSSEGRVGSTKYGDFRFLSIKPNNINGYLYVNLRQNKVEKTRSVHKLVALAFVEKPEGKDFINHINEDKHDNRASNLEWCTCKENTDHSSYRWRKTVEVVNQDGSVAGLFESVTEAAKHLGVCKSAISAVLHGRRDHVKGKTVRFKEVA